VNSCEKGKRGERQWRDELRAQGFHARRGQQFAGGPDSPDVVCDDLDWIHWEVKAVERLNIEAAIRQARRDAGSKWPFLAHRRSFHPWLVTMPADFCFRLLRGDFPAANRRAVDRTHPSHTEFGTGPEPVPATDTNNQTEDKQRNKPMSNLVLQCKESTKPHPEGIHPAVCVDVIDLGLVEVEFQGERRMVNKVKLVFESEQNTEDGKGWTVSKNFTASLHPKAKLADFLGKWRGRPVIPGETIDLSKLIGSNCTLVISHQQNLVGRTYASIDAISKPTKKVTPSGHYDPAETRRRIAEATAKAPGENGKPAYQSPQPTRTTSPALPAPKRALEPAKPEDQGFDPEVGF
jgi:hypothetical protein